VNILVHLNVYWTWYSCNYSQELLLWHQWYGKNITLQNCVTIMHGSKSVSRTAINSWLFITLFCNRKNSEGKCALSVFSRSLSWYLHIQISCLPSFLIYLKMKFYIYWCNHYYLDKQIKLFIMDWHSVFFLWQSQTDEQIKLFVMDWHSFFFLLNQTSWWNQPWITWKRLSQCSYRDLHYITYHFHLCSFLQVIYKKIT